MGKICVKCGHERRPEDRGPDYACPNCGVVYAFAEAPNNSKSWSQAAPVDEIGRRAVHRNTEHGPAALAVTPPETPHHGARPLASERSSTLTVGSVTLYADEVRKSLVEIAKKGANLQDTAAVAHAGWLLEVNGTGVYAAEVGSAIRLSPKDCSTLVIVWVMYFLAEELDRIARAGTGPASLTHLIQIGHYVEDDMIAIGEDTAQRFLKRMMERALDDRRK
jgi:hypothetical protein